MRSSIRCLLLGILAAAVVRHLDVWPLVAPPRADGITLWSALSFALAAVVEPDRDA